MKILLLDLERTIIDAWSDTYKPEIIHIEPIRNYIKLHKFDAIGVFSYALWNTKDLITFYATLRYEIEETFGFLFNQHLLFTVDRIRNEISNLTNIHFQDAHSFIGKFNKDTAFFHFLKSQQFIDHDVTLLDDMVDNVNIFHTDRVGRMVNINDIVDNYNS